MILPGKDRASVERAAQALSDQELLGLPTETVYGLAANALSEEATAKIYALKGRPPNHPLIAHVAGQNEITHFAVDAAPFAECLMRALWPGPLTIILNKIPGVATACSANLPTIALRSPANPVAQALLAQCRALEIWGLAAPSANRFGRVSPTRAEHVREAFGDDLLILDGGPCTVGIESTIVDCTRGRPIVLRPGILTLDQISAAAQCEASEVNTQQINTQTPRAPGTLDSHYAPNALVKLLSAEGIKALIAQQTLQSGANPARRAVAIWAQGPNDCQIFPANWYYLEMPSTARDCAAALFEQLRAFDRLSVAEIWVEIPPNTAQWAGIRDRLQRAAYAGTEPR